MHLFILVVSGGLCLSGNPLVPALHLEQTIAKRNNQAYVSENSTNLGHGKYLLCYQGESLDLALLLSQPSGKSPPFIITTKYVFSQNLGGAPEQSRTECPASEIPFSTIFSTQTPYVLVHLPPATKGP